MTQKYTYSTYKKYPSFSRRFFITRALTLVTTVSFGKGYSSLASGITPYPIFFTQDEYYFIETASECILPRDENGPGAHDLNVAFFIDQQMQTPYGQGDLWYRRPPFQSGSPEMGYQLPYTPRQLYRNGIYSLTQHCMQFYHSPFHSLQRSLQEKILSELEKGSLNLDDIPGSIFFEQLRNNTLEGAFSDPIYGGNRHMKGWIMLGFPGARADFMDWINQHGDAYPLGPVSISSFISKDNH